MKIIKRTADGLVLYVGEDLQLDDTTASGKWGCHHGLCDVVIEDVPDCPDPWLGGCYQYDGEWSIVDGMGEILQAHVAEREALQKQNSKQSIIDRISAMEREDLCNRGVREMCLYLLQSEATKKAAQLSTVEQPVTAEALLQANFFYVKLKARNEEITNLRNQLFVLA